VSQCSGNENASCYEFESFGPFISASFDCSDRANHSKDDYNGCSNVFEIVDFGHEENEMKQTVSVTNAF
jgi:hypothetical protein